MSETLSLATYFEQILPQKFAAALAGADAEVTEQDELTLTYDISGPQGGVYGLRVVNGQLEVVPGGIPASDILFTTGYDEWLHTHHEAWEEPAIDYVLRNKVQIIKGLKGTLKLELATEDGGEYNATTIFASTAEPEVIVRMTVPDYAAMVKGTLNGQMAFMTGKLKFEGSLPLLMQLGALNG